jgi:hypothetical protein
MAPESRPRAVGGGRDNGVLAEEVGLVRMILAILSTVLLLPVSALADEDSVGDPHDKMLFDVIRIKHGHSEVGEGGSSRLEHRVRYRKAFTGEEFRRDAFLGIAFLDRTEAIRVGWKDGKWKARMYNSGDGGSEGQPQVSRPDGRTISLTFPLWWLDADLESYRWRAYSMYSPRCEPGPSTAACVPPITDKSERLRHHL